MGVDDAMQRLKKLRGKILVFEFMPIVLIAAGFLMLVLNSTYIFGLISIGAGLLFMFFFRRQVPMLRKEYKTIYKNTFVKSMLDTMFEHVEYDWNMGFTEMDVRDFGIIKMGNRFHSEDYIRAAYKGVQFRQADVVIKHEMRSGNKRNIQTYFRGRMFEFNFASNMVGIVKIFSNSYNQYQKANREGYMIKMENIEFNSRFKVFSLNAHDAFYILTPQMMEKLLAINERYPSVAFCFAPGKLYVGIATGDSFDAKIGRKLSYPKEQARMQHDVQVIIDVIEMIDLIRDDGYINDYAEKEQI